jgi:protein-tyrosine phosphatase
MIDLHSHILPGVDDGAATLEDSLAMARMAVDDGIEVMACTPHFMPGMYDNTSTDILRRIERLNQQVADAGIDLALVSGADAHIRPDFVSCLRAGEILTVHNSRYVLFEPPHASLPKRMDDLLFEISVAGYVPVLTHPERLKWIEQNYPLVVKLAQSGVWMQITAGSLIGRFGKRPQYWAQRMLAEGLVSILASDAHNIQSRPPVMSKAYDIAVQELGASEADNLVHYRPLCILENQPAEQAPGLPQPVIKNLSFGSTLRRLFGMQQ